MPSLTISVSLKSSLRSSVAVSSYGVLGFVPSLVFDFKTNTYKTGGEATTFSSAITHAATTNATMTDGYGPNLVTNGTFDSDLSGWETSHGAWGGEFDNGTVKLIHTVYNSFTRQVLSGLVVGTTYEVSFSVTNDTQGSGGGSYVGIWETNLDASYIERFTYTKGVVGSYTFTFTATSTVSQIRLTKGSNTGVTNFDNVSVRQSPALKWRPHNNLTKSNNFSTWSKIAVVGVDNAATGPNGVANTASTVNFSTGGSYLYNLSTVAVSAGDKVTLAAWVRSDTITSITFAVNGRINGDNNTLETNLAVTSTWTLVSFEATVLGNDTGLFFIIGKYNASSPLSQIGDLEIYGAHVFRSDLGGMVNNPDTNSSYVPTTNTNVYLPRLGHHIYNGSAWINEGILHESEARTNVCTYSNDFLTTWAAANITITPNSAISPDGTMNATKFDMASNGYTRKLSGHVPTVGQTYTFSVWIKAGTASEVKTVMLFTGGGLGYTTVTQTLTNEWQRFTITSTLASGTPDQVRARFVATQAGTIFVYGAQIEEGATPSSYIPTASAQVTRAAETLTVPAANLPYDNTNMSIQIDGKMTYADRNTTLDVQPYLWELSSGSYISSRVSTVSTRTGQISFDQRAPLSGLDSVNGATNAYSPDTNVPFNIATRNGSTFINAAHEGTLLTANTTPTVLPDLSATDLNLGSTFMGTIGQFRMWSADLGDVGITEATLPSTEPSLSLTFDGSENSFIVLDWSE